MMKIPCVLIVLCVALSVALAGKDQKPTTKNLGYTYKRGQPSYENNNGGSFAGSYNQDKYARHETYPGLYDSKYSGEYRGQYDTGYNTDSYNKAYEPVVYTAYVSAYPAEYPLTPAQERNIIDVNAAFTAIPFLYGNSGHYNSPINANYDYNSYGNMGFRYFAPRLTQYNPKSQSEYKSESRYEAESRYGAESRYEAEVRIKVPASQYKTDSYRSDPYSTGPYKTDSYNNAPYKGDSYDQSNLKVRVGADYRPDSYNNAPYKKDSYAPYKGDSYEPVEYYKPDSYNNAPYKKDSYAPYNGDSYDQSKLQVRLDANYRPKTY